jgi:transposase
MARYKVIDTSPRFLAVDLDKQLLPGTFEHAIHHLIDREFDLSRFDGRYRNDTTGASAYPPGMLLKVVLFAYSQGIVSSRAIERACREHVTFIALSGDSAPHFTTIAHFVSSLGNEIAHLFGQVLYLCDKQGLIGREMFAIDGVKLPSNASKLKSGTRADFERQAAKLEAAAQAMVARHRETDALPVEPDLAEKAARRVKRLEADAAQLRAWLADHPEDRKGSRGTPRKSNRTDNDSAKMATDKGVLQGYTGVAAVDARHQVVVAAQAHGTGSEQALLLPMVEAARPLMQPATLLTADAGYHSEANLEQLAKLGVDALIADPGMRGRDERFKDQGKHKAQPDPLHNKQKSAEKLKHYRPRDFHHDPVAGTCICPAGQSLYSNGRHCTNAGRTHHKFQGSQAQCVPCSHRERCLRKPEKTKTRQVAFFAPQQASPLKHTEAMKQKIDSEDGRRRYGQRFATVEPVFGNIRHNKRLNRFTLRGQHKVDTQWKLFCLVHNIEKLAHHGYAQ